MRDPIPPTGRPPQCTESRRNRRRSPQAGRRGPLRARVRLAKAAATCPAASVPPTPGTPSTLPAPAGTRALFRGPLAEPTQAGGCAWPPRRGPGRGPRAAGAARARRRVQGTREATEPPGDQVPEAQGAWTAGAGKPPGNDTMWDMGVVLDAASLVSDDFSRVTSAAAGHFRTLALCVSWVSPVSPDPVQVKAIKMDKGVQRILGALEKGGDAGHSPQRHRKVVALVKPHQVLMKRLPEDRGDPGQGLRRLPPRLAGQVWSGV
ncbi:uncharacterized protein LOC115296495 [Suricata suricatta]|uniref:uncharacterized protein LOC115296495 n=1 Tax=Suricata suricatta TaxID=37032 RepID=UPI001156075F|nr:uncharacterized protein LOC115296495 [Suricata suricatta]